MQERMDVVMEESRCTNLLSQKFVEEENEIKGEITYLEAELKEAKTSNKRENCCANKN